MYMTFRFLRSRRGGSSSSVLNALSSKRLVANLMVLLLGAPLTFAAAPVITCPGNINAGTDAGQCTAVVNFNATALELSELLVWNAWSTDRTFTPYVFGGIGLSFLNIKRDYSNFNGEFFTSEDLASRLTEDISHDPPKLVPVVPIGIGVQYALRKNLSLIGETAYRLTRTDYLDGFSKAGNPELYDHYQSHTVGVLYKFGKKNNLNCPTTF